MLWTAWMPCKARCMMGLPQDLYHSTHAAAAGITTVAAYQLWSEPHEDPPWRDVVPHFRDLGPRELAPFEAAGGACCPHVQHGPAHRLSDVPRVACPDTDMQWACAGGCKYAQGWCFTTIICEQSLYIPWLMDRALRAGVSLQCRTIQNLQVAIPASFPTC